MAAIVLQYTSFRFDVDFLLTKQYIIYKWHYQLAFYTHIFSGLAVLLSGFVQFNMRLLALMPIVHRAAGWIYCVGVLAFAGPAGLWMALYANGGFSAQVSFALQAVLWMLFTLLALRSAVLRKWADHREWMIRSYSLTLAALTLRFFSFLLPHFVTIPGQEMYQTLAWISWVPNIMLAEVCIRMGFFPLPQKKEPTG
jgi:hypothetical protein